MDKPLVIEFPDSALKDFTALMSSNKIKAEPFNLYGFVGSDSISSYLIYLTPAVLAAFIKGLSLFLRRYDNIRIKFGGVEISGLSPDNTILAIKKLMEKANHDDES